MAGFQVTGHLISKLAKIGGQSQKGPWEKQEFVIQTMENEFPKIIAFTAWNDTIEKLRPFQKNAVIKLSFSAESREHNGRYYTELRAFKIEAGEVLTPKEPVQRQSAGNERQAARRESPQAAYSEDFDEDDGSSDLPF